MTRLLAGRYRLDEPAGRGGLAVVWRAHDTVLDRTVAVKLLASRPGGARSEAVAAAGLDDPHVARVYDYGETRGADGVPRAYLVMEFVEGPTLAARLAQEGRYDWREAARICAGVAEALAAAHDQGLVHRDIKPANVMLSGDEVKVVDFGLAVRAGERPEDVDGCNWGTPAYLAPELLRGAKAVPAADVWSLGVLLRSCLTAEPPWPGHTIDEILAARRTAPFRRLPAGPGLPPALVRLYEQCIDPRPAARPPARTVARTLHALITPGAVLPPPARPGVSRRVVAVALVVAAILAGALTLQLLTAHPASAGGPGVSGVEAGGPGLSGVEEGLDGGGRGQQGDAGAVAEREPEAAAGGGGRGQVGPGTLPAQLPLIAG
jgi:eukaryotic-like serine/threonine-protein kinase